MSAQGPAELRQPRPVDWRCAQVLIVGGTTDYANPGTTAAATSLLLDFSVQPLAWVTERTGVPRVMPDAVMLPDGTVAVVNGGNIGIAGGGSGTANAAVVGPPTAAGAALSSGVLAAWRRRSAACTAALAQPRAQGSRVLLGMQLQAAPLTRGGPCARPDRGVCVQGQPTLRAMRSCTTQLHQWAGAGRGCWQTASRTGCSAPQLAQHAACAHIVLRACRSTKDTGEAAPGRSCSVHMSVQQLSGRHSSPGAVLTPAVRSHSNAWLTVNGEVRRCRWPACAAPAVALVAHPCLFTVPGGSSGLPEQQACCRCW